MALKKNVLKNITLVGDVNFSAYIKITSFSGNKESMSFEVTYFKEETQDVINQTHFIIKPNLDGNNFIKQAYEHLKGLPEFESAIDC